MSRSETVNHSSSSKEATGRLFGFVQIVMVLSAVATILTLFATSWWVADLCSNLRIQWMVALLCGAALFAVSKRWKQAAICVLICCLHVPTIISGYGYAPQSAVNPDTNFSVATFNVLTSNSSYEAIEKQLTESNADVIAVIELSGGLERHLAENFAKQYPWSRTEVPSNGNFGIGLYSKHQWASARIFSLNDERLPSIDAEVTINGQPVYVVATHTLPPIGAYGSAHRNKHLDLLAERVNNRKALDASKAGADAAAIVVMGDLNLTPWSPYFQKFSSDCGMKRNGQGVQPTWYVFPVFPFGLVLDHVLTSDKLRCVSHQVSPAAGSDHRMVTVGLTPVDDSVSR